MLFIKINRLRVNTREGEGLSGAGANGDKLAVAAFIVSTGRGLQASNSVFL